MNGLLSVVHPTPTFQNRVVRRRRAAHDTTPEATTTLNITHPTVDNDNILALQRTIGNRATQNLLQRDEPQGAKKPPSKTLFMGLNSGSKGEAATLKGVLKDNVIAAMNDPSLEKSLETEEGIGKWIATELPGLVKSPLQVLAAFSTLQQCDAAARDQMAQVIKMFYAAEQGEFTLERIVLSGHSNGVELWGDAEKNFNPGSFLLDQDMKRLTTAFPKAAGQVEDVMFSACYTVSSIELMIKVFPNLRTVWGYAGFSPAAGKGAEQHIAQWERETRGDKALDAKDGMGKAALWTRDAAKSSKDGRGYIRNDPAKANFKELAASFYGLGLDVKKQLQGESPLNPTILNMAYGYVQSMLAHPEIPSNDHKIATQWSEILLRMRYYERVTQKFAETYTGDIKKGYDAMALKPPDFSKMTRKALKLEMEKFKKALEDTPNTDGQAFYDKFLTGLSKLDTELIPAKWI
jgi:hypothetical protein